MEKVAASIKASSSALSWIEGVAPSHSDAGGVKGSSSPSFQRVGSEGRESVSTGPPESACSRTPSAANERVLRAFLVEVFRLYHLA